MSGLSATIPERESLYLDLLRATSAILVVLGHAPYYFDVGVPRLGHHAVMVFFVLSGYVISNTTSRRENTPSAYIIARLSRLWSVLVPALAITIAFDWIALNLGSQSAASIAVPSDYPFIRGFAALLFLSESWVSIQPFSMGVFWSLCCEFWYYVFFAVIVFMPKSRIRIILAFFSIIIGGQKTILLFPVWLMGVCLDKSSIIRRFSEETDIVLFFVGGLGFFSIIIFKIYDFGFDFVYANYNPDVLRHLAQARLFWLDWIFGFCIAVHLLGARTAVRGVPLERLKRPIRWCAGVSFAAYLLHLPLYHLVAAWLPRSQGPLAIAIVFLSIALLAPPIERSRFGWRVMLTGLAQRSVLFRTRKVLAVVGDT